MRPYLLRTRGLSSSLILTLWAEERFVALAADPTGRVLVTIFAYAEANIRIISARRASAGERKRYEKR